MDEYTAVKDRKGRGGKARFYGKMPVEKIRPFVGAEISHFARPEEHGNRRIFAWRLAALYLGQRYPSVFGKIAAVSPSVWWSGRDILRCTLALKSKLPLRIWLDTGCSEGAGTAEDARDLRYVLIAKGWRLGKNLAWMEDPGGTHDEDAWATRVEPLQFLYLLR